MTIPQDVHERAANLAMALTSKPSSDAVWDAIKYLGDAWAKAGINLTKCVDAYNTTTDVAKTCVGIMHDIMREAGHSPESYQYVEPSAGSGPFLKWLPNDTIAMDILPRHTVIRRGEFLTWNPPHSDRPYAVVGAPPLGKYSDVSVAFINKALSFADMVGMVVQRRIKPSRISGRILHTLPLERGAVLDMTGRPIRYKMEWNVWSKFNHA